MIVSKQFFYFIYLSNNQYQYQSVDINEECYVGSTVNSAYIL